MKNIIKVFHILIIGLSIFSVRYNSAMELRRNNVPIPMMSMDFIKLKKPDTTPYAENYNNPMYAPIVDKEKLGALVRGVSLGNRGEREIQKKAIITKRDTTDIKERKPAQSKPLSRTVRTQQKAFDVQLNKYIAHTVFDKAYYLLQEQENRLFQEGSILGCKLFKLVFGEIESVEEFCKDLVVFPENTGSMSKKFANFGRNEKFCENYRYVLRRIEGGDESFSPVIIALLENRKYGTTRRIG